VAVLACAPALAQPRTPGAKPAPDSVEGGFWDVMDKAEREARRKAELNADPALNAYVRDVVCKMAAEHCSDIRLYVMDRPFFNAQMAPNGYSEVWSGLLLRCEDEAELAFVLGHEVTHFVENHTIEAHRAEKSRRNTAMVLMVGVAVVGAVAAAGSADYQSAQSINDATSGLVDAIYLASIASYFRFSREQETEADLQGVRRLASVGYRPGASATIWRRLMAETADSDFDRVRRQNTRLGIFDSHPLEPERAARLEGEAAKLVADAKPVQNRHRAAIRPFLGAWLKDDLRRRDFGETLHIIDRLAQSKEDLGVLNFYRGEAYRQRGKDGDLARAASAYRESTLHADAPAVAWRELGEAQRRGGDRAGARASLEAYLARAPEAEDGWMVRETLDSLSKGV
jgi:predicted Zn-dependent protease